MLTRLNFSSLLLGIVVASSYSNPMAIADISDDICASYMAIVSQGLQMRQQGIPIDSALSMTDSAYNVNPSLYSVLQSSIAFVYSNPQDAARALDDGTLVKACAKAVRGF